MTRRGAVLADDRIHLGERLVVSLQRTLRVPDDGRTYPLPPGLGRFPVRRAADYADRLPLEWRGDFLIPMYRREALWIAFEGTWWKPNAVKVGVGGIDAISGAAWNEKLRDDPQNYLVAPDQPWLDGINSGSETVRQFVATPMGEGYTVEAQITGEERTGGIEIAAFEPLPGKFPDAAPATSSARSDIAMVAATPQTLGIGAGGNMRQKIYPDRYGLETWDDRRATSVFVRLVLAGEFRAITGEAEPPTPVDPAAYTAAGLPWFELYDDSEKDLDAADALRRIRSIRELERGQSDAHLEVTKSQIRGLRRKK